MKKLAKLRDVKSLVEYNGDFFTPVELAEHLKVTGDFEVIVHDEDETWFGKALSKLKDVKRYQ